MTNSINKSFIIHKDSLLILDKLSDAQAGKLFKAIKTFQESGKIIPLDFALEIALAPFLNQFARDSQNYSNSIFQGKLGNLKKYHKEIYLRVVSKELTIEQGEDLAYPDKKLYDRPPITPDQMGSLSDSVSKNKINNKKSFTAPTLEEVKKYCIESNRSVDAKKFFDYYDTGNWIDGKGQAVKNWKQKLITWEGKNETPIQNNQKSCTPINKLIGKELISKIEVDGKTAKLHFKTENDYQALINLDQSLRDKIKAELTKEFGATKFEFKF